MSYKVYTRNEHSDCSSSTFVTREEALAFVKDELEFFERWGAREACVIHPDGTKEYWRTETTLTATPTDDYDWCDESYTEES